MARLGEYDGRSTEVLERIRNEGAPGRRRLDEAIGLVDSDVTTVSDGATWLLRAWLDGGTSLGSEQLRELADRLERIDSPWARQHIAQSVGNLGVPLELAERFAAFLRADVASDRPFLRAWAMDGLVRLADQHAGYAEEAERALRAAFEDPAASVRARARRVDAER